MNKGFSKRLVDLVEERNMKQKELAAVLHIAPTTLSGYMTGNRYPNYNMLIQIAKYFQVSVDYLLGTSSIRKKPTKALSVKESNLLGLYRRLSVQDQDMLMEQALLFEKKEWKVREAKRAGRRKAPEDLDLQ